MKFTHAIVTIIASTLLLFITGATSLAQAQAAQMRVSDGLCVGARPA